MKLFEKKFSNFILETYSQSPNFKYQELKQVHGIQLVKEGQENIQEADGWLSFDLQTPLLIKTADCLPLLLVGKKGLAFLHAGWKGLKDRIFDQPQIHELEVEEFFIGPCIHQENYQVRDNFKQNFPDNSHFHSYDGKRYFDLVNYAMDHIRKVYPGVSGDESGICTFSHPDFHSFRRTSTSKRNYNIIRSHL